MSIILEFSIPSEEFHLGRAVSGTGDVHVELERLVPTGERLMPYLWVTGNEVRTFEKTVRSHPSVRALKLLDTVDDSRLYRIEWGELPETLIAGIDASDAAILQAGGGARWTFRLRFSDHERLSTFHNHVIEHGLPVHIERTYTLTESTEHGHQFDLSQEQRDALVMALRRGYFETPSEASLEELATEFGISQQALSNRIRRGTKQVLTEALLSSTGSS
jgi:predicted DNA binding protein